MVYFSHDGQGLGHRYIFKEVITMTTVRKIIPKETPVEVRSEKRALRPFGRGMEDFFEMFPRRWMESMMEPFMWRRPLLREFEEFGEAFYPHVDLVDREADLLVRAELPGVKKQDLDISIVGDRLTIQAKREYKEEENKETFFRSEMGYGTLLRTVLLPVDVDTKKAKAELKDGILEILLPKIEVQKSHKIKVA
jgi:HSP20 family protein